VKSLYETLSFCPRCGTRYSPDSFDPLDVRFACHGCGYDFYQNSIPSSVAVVPRSGTLSKVLFLTRSTEPAIGKLALPGGFLRYAEEPCDGVRREVLEETSLDIAVERLLCETVVAYPYCGASVSVLELAFVTRPVDADLKGIATGEASCIDYYDVCTVLEDSSALAFPEHRGCSNGTFNR